MLRGLHYQLPEPQGKLVRCAAGAVWDVAVDLRRGSATFGQWFGTELSADNKRQLWIPVGLAHGFLALTDGAEVLYKTTSRFNPAYDRALAWNDPAIAVAWPIDEQPTISKKDRTAPTLDGAVLFDEPDFTGQPAGTSSTDQ